MLNLKINHESVWLSGLEVNTMCSCHHGFKTSSRPLLDIICFLPEFPVMFHWVLSSEAEVSWANNTDVWSLFTLFLLMSAYLKKNRSVIIYFCAGWKTAVTHLTEYLKRSNSSQKKEEKKVFESLIFFSSSKSVFNFTPLWINSSYQCVHYTTLLSLSVTKEKELASRKLSLRNMSVYELYCHIYVFLFRGLLFYNRAVHFKQGCHRKVW